MAFGGGGNANYQANFILNTSQAAGALQGLDRNIQRALGNVEKAAGKAVSAQLTQMDRTIANMAGTTGNSAKTFKVLDTQGQQVTRTLYSMTKAQRVALSSTDKLRARTIGFRDSLADLKKSGSITTKSLGTLADNIDNVAFRAGAARGGQLKKLSAGIRTMSQDLADANAAANPPPAPATQPNLFQRIAARFQRKPAPAAAPATGGGGRRTGSGGGNRPGPTGNGDTVRGQEMPMRSKAAAHNLLQLGSAAQGVMIGISALDKNVTSLAFGLIFLSYGVLSTAVVTAGLTIALVGAKRALSAITSASLAAGQAFEASGQQMANWYRSGEMAMKVKAENIQIAKAYGISIDAADKARFAMEKVGLKGPDYMKAVLNASAAGNGAPEEIAGRLAALSDVRTRPEARGRMVEQFAQDMNIPIKQYANSLEIIDALNKRYAGSAAASAKTTQGAVATMTATWQEFTINVGVLLNEYIKPVVEVATSFLQGMVDGFKDAFKTEAATGKLKQTVEGLQVSVRKLAPYLHAIGAILGRVIYKAAILAARGLKVLADVLRGGLKWVKEYKDEFTAAGQSFKKNFLDVAISAPTILRGVLAFLEGFGVAFAKAFTPKKIATKLDFSGVEVVGSTEGASAGFWEKLLLGFKTAPKALLEGIAKGIKAGIIFALLEALTLTAVDMLPISDNLKKSLDGIVRITFTGAALGMIFGPGGMLVGAVLGAAIGAGLESISPGLSGKIMDWVDKTMMAGLKRIGTFVVDTVVPALAIAGTALGAWVNESAVPAFEKFHGWVNDKIVPAVVSFAQETSDKLMPKLKDFGNWLQNDGGPNLMDFSQKIGIGALNATRTFGDYLGTRFGPLLGQISSFLMERVGPALISLAGWFNDNIMPGLTAVGGFLVEHLIPAIIEFYKWNAEKLTPVLQALVNLGLSVVIGYIKSFIAVLDFLWPAIDAIVKVLGHMFDALVDVGRNIWDTFGPGLTSVGNLLNDTVLPAVKGVVEKGLDVLTDALNTLSTMVASPFDTMSTAISNVTTWLIRLWDWVVDLKDKISNISWPEPPDWVKKAFGIVATSGAGLGDMFSVGIGMLPHANGGFVRGFGSGDTVPIMATPGELILNAAQQRNVAARMNGGSGINIYMTVTDSVITNGAAMEAFTGMVASKITSRLGSAKSMTFHRIA